MELGSARSWLRSVPDRLLHPLRRRLALRRLRTVEPATRLLFVCHGNVCRSPFAHRYCVSALEDRGAGGMEVAGRGFVGPGRPSPQPARRAASDLGVELGDHRSRLLEWGDLEVSGTLVLVFEPGQRRRIVRKGPIAGERVHVLGDLDPERIRRRRICDPMGHPVEVFRSVYRRIARCVDELLEALPLEDVPPEAGLRGDPVAGTTGRSAGGR